MSRRRVVIAAVALVAAAWPVAGQAATTGTGNWPMFGDGPAQNANNRAETILSAGNVSGLKVLHTYANWTSNFIQPTTAVVGTLGYSVTGSPLAVSKGIIAAFALASGAEVWHHQIFSHDDSWYYAPAVQDGRLFIGGDTAMYAFNATTGKLLWKYNAGTTVLFNAVTVAANGTVYASTYETGKVYAFNPTTGHVIWSTVPPGPFGSCCAGPVSISHGIAYVATATSLFAMNVLTGAAIFNVPAVGEDAAISGGVAYVESANALQAYNASNGAKLWSSLTQTGNTFSSLAPAVDGNTVIATTPRYVIAFNATTGARDWTFNSGSDSTDYSGPSIANGVVYAGSVGDGVQAFNEATGAVLFRGAANCGNAVVSNGRVYAPCNGGEAVFGL